MTAASLTTTKVLRVRPGRIGHTRSPGYPENRGMINKAYYMLRVEG